jgi:hypothetical protein
VIIYAIGILSICVNQCSVVAVAVAFNLFKNLLNQRDQRLNKPLPFFVIFENFVVNPTVACTQGTFNPGYTLCTFSYSVFSEVSVANLYEVVLASKYWMNVNLGKKRTRTKKHKI